MHTDVAQPRDSTILAALRPARSEQLAPFGTVHGDSLIILSVTPSTITYDNESSKSAIYSITAARDRLALLALLAALAPRRTVVELPQTFELFEQLRQRSPMLWQVMRVQRGLSLGLTESKLAARIAVDTSTLRRWFRSCGSSGPSRFMQWIRIVELISQIERTNLPASRVIELLGLAPFDSIRRSLRMLTGRALGELRESPVRQEILGAFKAKVNRLYAPE